MIPRVFVHRLSANNVIEYVNEAWNEFATEHDAQEQCGHVLGTSLWDHIAGAEVQHIWKILLERFRRTGREVNIPYRCDSPTKRRYMTMRLRLLEHATIECTSLIVREVTQFPAFPLGRSSSPENGKTLIKMCAWCNQIRAPHWVEFEQGVKRLRLLEMDQIGISHGICKACKKQVRSESIA